MIFKDIKKGYPIFVFDKSEVTLEQLEVINVSTSHSIIDSKTGLPQFNSSFQPIDMYVDITIKYNDNNTKTFVIRENSEITYADNLVIATSQNIILQEVEAFKRQSEQIIAQCDKCKDNVDKCNSIILAFNPIERDKQKNEERLTNLEQSVVDVKDSISEIKDLLNSFIVNKK